MVDRHYKAWLEKYATSSEMEMSNKGQALLDQMVRDGLDYAKYNLEPMKIVFAIYYVFHTGNNAKKAAQMAGYPDNIATIATRWVRGKKANSNLTDFISELVSSFGASPTQVVGFLTSIMQADFWGSALDFVPASDGTDAMIPQLNLERVAQEGLTPLIKTIKWHHNGNIQTVELHDAIKAAQLLGETHGMYKKHVEIHDLSKAIKEAGISEESVEKAKQDLKENLKQQMREKRLASKGTSS